MEFVSTKAATEALKRVDGSVLDSHALQVKPSTKRLTVPVPVPVDAVPAAARGEGGGGPVSNKLIVRNVAFQASKKELAGLFGAFGSLKRVRIPKKMGGDHRGFAFVEFNSSREAMAAKEALKDLHLYGARLHDLPNFIHVITISSLKGRHLVVEWAHEEEGGGSAGLMGLGAAGSAVDGEGGSSLQRLRKRASLDMAAIQTQSMNRAKRTKGDSNSMDYVEEGMERHIS